MLYGTRSGNEIKTYRSFEALNCCDRGCAKLRNGFDKLCYIKNLYENAGNELKNEINTCCYFVRHQCFKFKTQIYRCSEVTMQPKMLSLQPQMVVTQYRTITYRKPKPDQKLCKNKKKSKEARVVYRTWDLVVESNCRDAPPYQEGRQNIRIDRQKVICVSDIH